ncbi:MAG: hypothetical protein GY884_10055 [Proteobacteria bacterium]|nr:hypothetical protein [Pseudomonadota bacterium]
MGLRYLDQDCPLTLREGLDEYFAGIEGLLTEDNCDAEVARLFRHHDIGHVVFGCDTTLRGEPLADTWCVMGTTVTVREYLKYAELPETQAIFKEAGLLRVMWVSLLVVPSVLRALWCALRMPKKFPYWEPDVWMDVPLVELRREFGIQVVRH